MIYHTLGVQKVSGGRLPKALMPWYSVEIVTLGDQKVVIFNSKLHATKAASPTFTWSKDVPDYKILEDPFLIQWVDQKYGNVHQEMTRSPF